MSKLEDTWAAEAARLKTSHPDWQEVEAGWLTEWDAVHVAVPQCQLSQSECGAWRIERYEVGHDRSLHLMAKDMRNRHVRPRVWTPAGTYARLVATQRRSWGWSGELTHTGEIMHDQHYELRCIRDFLSAASGRILVGGLGLGLLPNAALLRDDIESVTIVEIEPDVIEMVGAQFADNPRVRIVEGNAWNWTPPDGERFDWAWHDTLGEYGGTAVAILEHYGDFVARQRFYTAVDG